MPCRHAPEQRANVDELASEDRAASLEARQIEQIPDDALHTSRFLLDDTEIAFAGGRVELKLRHRQRLEIAPHRGERRHQLVRHVGEQLAPRLVGCRQRCGPRLQVGSHAVEGSRQRSHFVAAVFGRAGGRIARTNPCRGVFELP